MNKLVSKNPVLRFKEGKKIVKAYRGEKVIANVGGKDIEVTIELAKKNGWNYRTKNILDLRMLHFGSLDRYNKFNKSLTVKTKNSTITKIGEGSENSRGKVATPKPSALPDNMRQSGRIGGWNRNIGLGTIDDTESNRMITELGWQGLTAELVQLKLNENNTGGWGVTVDNKWGNQSRNALKGYYDRWSEERKRNIQKPLIAEEPVSPYQIMLLNTVQQKPTIPMPEYRTYNDYTANDFSNRLRGLNINSNDSLRNWMNTTGVLNYNWQGNNWARQFRSDVDKALGGDYSDTNIRNTFGTQGRWGKGFLGRGDYGDFQNAMQTNAGIWNGIYDARLGNLIKNMDWSKFKLFKQGGNLPSRNSVKRFKLGGGLTNFIKEAPLPR